MTVALEGIPQTSYRIHIRAQGKAIRLSLGGTVSGLQLDSLHGAECQDRILQVTPASGALHELLDVDGEFPLAAEGVLAEKDVKVVQVEQRRVGTWTRVHLHPVDDNPGLGWRYIARNGLLLSPVD